MRLAKKKIAIVFDGFDTQKKRSHMISYLTFALNFI